MKSAKIIAAAKRLRNADGVAISATAGRTAVSAKSHPLKPRDRSKGGWAKPKSKKCFSAGVIRARHTLAQEEEAGPHTKGKPPPAPAKSSVQSTAPTDPLAESDRRLMPPPRVPQGKRAAQDVASKPADPDDKSLAALANEAVGLGSTMGRIRSSVASATGADVGGSGVEGSSSSDTADADQAPSLTRYVGGLLRDRCAAAQWDLALRVYYATPLAALLDSELAHLNRIIAEEAKAQNWAGKFPRVRFTGVVLD